jgi:hypothetical protein
MKTVFAIALFAVVALPACGQEQSVSSNTDYAELRGLKIEEAAADARKAAAAKDYRLLAVKGYTIEVPGAGDDVSKLEKEYGIRVLSGTSDAVRGEEQRRLNANARDYARKYNETILSIGKAASSGHP